MIRLFSIALVFFLFSCDNHFQNNALPDKTPVTPVIIDVQPFDDVPKEKVDFVVAELKKVYSNVIVKRSIELPSMAYYSKRNRYRADSIIRYFRSRTPKGHVTLALTTKDISTTKGKTEDYGVMGLGYQPGPSCVISSFRLSKNNTLEQYFKVAIHELGHTQGLPHCPEKKCFMRDAEGKNHTDEETDFCTKCKAHLVSRGWSFKK